MSQPRKTEVRTLAATDDEVLVEVSGNRRKAAEFHYRYAAASFALAGERAATFIKLIDGVPASLTYTVRYGPGVLECDCNGGEAHEKCGRPVCKHALALCDLVNEGFLPEPKRTAA